MAFENGEKVRVSDSHGSYYYGTVMNTSDDKTLVKVTLYRNNPSEVGKEIWFYTYAVKRLRMKPTGKWIQSGY